MVSKCANPDCSVPFRYFHTGKLFRAETSLGLDRRRTLGQEVQQSKPLRHLEFFWLCEDCAGKMTITFDKESGVAIHPRDRAHTAAAA
jgi:hypothetical protein